MPVGVDYLEEARLRKASRSVEESAKTEWFIDEVSSKIELTMKQRVRLATEFVKNKIIRNISVPVKKEQGKRSGRIIVTERSKPGEYPRADTTQLMKTLFSDYIETKGSYSGFVGTPLDYGVKLELKMARSFLVRTLNEERDKIMKILTGPIT